MVCDLIIEGAAIVNFILLGHFRDDFWVSGVRLGSFWASLGSLLGSPGRSGPAEGFGPVSGRPQDAQKVVLHADLGPPKALIFRKRRGREDKKPLQKCTFSGR